MNLQAGHYKTSLRPQNNEENKETKVFWKKIKTITELGMLSLGLRTPFLP